MQNKRQKKVIKKENIERITMRGNKNVDIWHQKCVIQSFCQ